MNPKSKDIQNQYQGYKKTPVLWKDNIVFGLQQFEIPKQNDTVFNDQLPENLRLGSQWDGAQYDPTYGPIDPFLAGASTSRLFFDASAGLLYFFKGRDNKFTAYVGFSVQHINEPNESLAGGVAQLPRKCNNSFDFLAPFLTIRRNF